MERQCTKRCPIHGSVCLVCTGPAVPAGLPFIEVPFEEHRVHLCENGHVWED